MKKEIYQTVEKIQLPTINRGERSFIISKNDKGYFAHELGDLTQWAKVFNTGELKAHRLNHTRKCGNQYGRYFKPIPFTNAQDAMSAIIETANTKIWYY